MSNVETATTSTSDDDDDNNELNGDVDKNIKVQSPKSFEQEKTQESSSMNTKDDQQSITAGLKLIKNE